jgi:hypothetical protein
LDVQALRAAVGAMLRHMSAEGVLRVATTRESLCTGEGVITSVGSKGDIGGSSHSVSGEEVFSLKERWESDVRPALSHALGSHRHSLPEVTTPLTLVVYSEGCSAGDSGS